MKIGFAQLNTTVGDFVGNRGKLAEAYRELVEGGAELVLAPELAVCGYPPQDLVFKSRFVPTCAASLAELAEAVGEVPFVVGYVEENSGSVGAPFYNAAAVLHRGEIAHRTRKTLLPTYDVFDEGRYFAPGEGGQPFVHRGKRLGITICEDIWTEKYLRRRLYDRDPVENLRVQGIDLLVNLSASPFSEGKPSQRLNMIREVAATAGCPVVYCNAVGGNDQLIFDGHSMAVGVEGRAVALGGFREANVVLDLDELPAAPPVFASEIAQVHDALVLGLGDYARKCGFKSAVLGLSGGIDSAVTACLAVEAFGAANVHGVSLPSRYSSDGSKDDAAALAANLGMAYRTVPIESMFRAVRGELDPLFEGRAEDATEENLQARLRGVTLMALSNKFGHLLLTTGNKSELAVGYCTLYGDMCGGLAVISDLPKTQVYELARHINREGEIIPWSSITKPPSAELRPDQRDQDTLPPYEILDAILELYVEESLSGADIIARGFDESTVRWVQRRVDLNEYKREQAAPGLRVTSKAFGSGRRIPIAQRFVG